MVCHQLYRRALDQIEAVPIPGTKEPILFFPDGAWIGFAVGGALKKVALAGGSTATTVGNGDKVVRGASWGEGDMMVFDLSATAMKSFACPQQAVSPNRSRSEAEPDGRRQRHPTVAGRRWLLFQISRRAALSARAVLPSGR